MPGAETTIERLRHYLSLLKPQARSLLIGELERSVLRGDDIPGVGLSLKEWLLCELRCIVRNERVPMPRSSQAAQLFFKPLAPFLVDDPIDYRHHGRLARVSPRLPMPRPSRWFSASSIGRYFAGELALNGMTKRAGSELHLYRDSATRGLLDGLCQASGAERSFRQSQLDTPVEACSRVFGEEYAAVPGKAAEIARVGECRLAPA